MTTTPSFILFRKELRSLAPAMVMQFAVFYVLTMVYVLVTRVPDQQPLSESYEAGEGTAIIGFLVAFTLGLGHLMREHDDGTIAFLDSLPISRLRIFAAKVCAALVALVVMPVSWLAASVPFAVASRTSLDESLHLGYAFTLAGLIGAVALVGYGWGLGLAPLRRFAWLVLALCGLVVVRFQDDHPVISLFRPVVLLEPRMSGATLIVPWSALAAQLSLALAGMAVAALVFAGAVDRIAHGFAALAGSRRGRALLAVSVVLVAATWLALGMMWTMKRAAEEPPDVDATLPGVTFSSARPQRIDTRSYRFLVPGSIDAATRARVTGADAIHDAVRVYFGADINEVPAITVDAAAPLGEQTHLGLTQWQAVSMSSGVLADDEQFAIVLAHETAHVYANVVSDRRLAAAHATTRLFHEGLATVVAEELVHAPVHRLAAAFARKRRAVDTAMLFDDAALMARVDPSLAYGLGRELVRATIDVGGSDAPVRVLRALARPDVPRDLDGLTLMRDAYQAADLDLDQVIARFYERLDDALVASADRLARIPTTRAGVDVSDGKVRVRLLPDGEPPPDAVGVCQVRARPDAPATEIRMLRAWGGACTLPHRTLPHATAGVQVGWLVDGEALLEPWNEVPLR